MGAGLSPPGRTAPAPPPAAPALPRPSGPGPRAEFDTRVVIEPSRNRGVELGGNARLRGRGSGARHKVRGRPLLPPSELVRHRRVVEAFLAAARAGDIDAVLAVLAPDVVRRCDARALPPGAAAVVRGARAVAEGTVLLASRADAAAVALVDGRPGVVVAPQGRLTVALAVTVEDDLITGYDVVADPERLSQLVIGLLDPA